MPFLAEKSSQVEEAACTKQEQRAQVNSALKETFEEIDEGQLLVVNGVQYRNCCLPLAVARGLEGLKPGQMLFDDYLAKVVEDDSAMIACLVIPEENITRVWAGTRAALATSKMIVLKYLPGHFTTLLPKHSDPPSEMLLKDLPPVQCFSFVGSSDVMEAMCKAQKKTPRTSHLDRSLQMDASSVGRHVAGLVRNAWPSCN